MPVKAFLFGEKGWLFDREMGLNGVSSKSLLYRITRRSQDDCNRGTATTIPLGWLIAQRILDAIAENRYDVLQKLGYGPCWGQIEQFRI